MNSSNSSSHSWISNRALVYEDQYVQTTFVLSVLAPQQQHRRIWHLTTNSAWGVRTVYITGVLYYLHSTCHYYIYVPCNIPNDRLTSSF